MSEEIAKTRKQEGLRKCDEECGEGKYERLTKYDTKKVYENVNDKKNTKE